MFLTINRCFQKIRQYRYNSIFIVLLFISVTTLLLNYKRNEDLRKCFIRPNKNEKGAQLDDILLSKRKPQPNRSIFFHETSCSIEGESTVNLNARQACAIESAALLNPHLDIFVLFSSPNYLYNISTHPSLEAVLTYPNVYIRYLNVWTYAADTPVSDWFTNGELFSSKHISVHLSDFLRFLTLWRWGGTYLDLDVIVKKSLEDIPWNYAGAESNILIGNSVMHFDASGFGHEFAKLCLNEFQMRFKGHYWSYNGPEVITRVLTKICKTTSTLVMNRDRCFGFHVYPKEAFYAVPFENWDHFFEASHLEETLEKTKESYIVHVWNALSKNRRIKVGANVAYGKLAEQYCPKVYSSSGEYF